MNKLFNYQMAIAPQYDRMLLWVWLGLLGLGLVMVYSSSIALAELHHGNSAYYLIRQAIYLMVGLILAYVVFHIPTVLVQQYAFLGFFLGCGLLLAVLLVGKEVGGGQRWLRIGFINLQPSEFMKLFVAIYVADYAMRRWNKLENFWHGLLPIILMMAVVGILLLLEPDFGAFVVISGMAMAILFRAGISSKFFIGMVLVFILAAIVLVIKYPYRWARVVGSLDPWLDPYGKGYQSTHALMAFGRGEWWGVGLGESVEKLLYLPEPHTDFLVAIIAEELGYVGFALLVVMLGFLVWRALSISRNAHYHQNYFASLLATGLVSWWAGQSLISVFIVNLGVGPVKGLTLPFLSFGGSSLVACCIGMGMLLRVDFENRRLLRGRQI